MYNYTLQKKNSYVICCSTLRNVGKLVVVILLSRSTYFVKSARLAHARHSVRGCLQPRICFSDDYESVRARVL
jgi:hypothetical protein